MLQIIAQFPVFESTNLKQLSNKFHLIPVSAQICCNSATYLPGITRNLL